MKRKKYSKLFYNDPFLCVQRYRCRLINYISGFSICVRFLQFFMRNPEVTDEASKFEENIAR